MESVAWYLIALNEVVIDHNSYVRFDMRVHVHCPVTENPLVSFYHVCVLFPSSHVANLAFYMTIMTDYYNYYDRNY